jgi:SynChlorMet cassette radical SAM/SPASM protein ScmF
MIKILVEIKMANQILQLPEGVPALNTYYVYLTNGCNLACQHCWLTPTYQVHGGTGGHLDYGLFALAIEEGLPLGLRSVKLTGGEPLLHPDFIQIVDLLREKELDLNIETNGVLMTITLAHYLKEKSTLSFISVSLDGAIAETHDPFRGVKGSFDKAVQGIRYLVAEGFHPQVIMSIHAGNVNEIEALIRLAENLGAGSVKFNLIQPTGRGEIMKEREQVLTIHQLVKTGKWVEDELQKRTSIDLFFSWPMGFYGIKRLYSMGSTGTCGIHTILGILPTGQLAMCGIGREIPELCYGKLGIDNLMDVWYNNLILNSLRKEIPEKLEGVCSNCIFKKQCLGSCIAENYHQSKHLQSAFWFCNEAREAGLFPSTRLINSFQDETRKEYWHS